MQFISAARFKQFSNSFTLSDRYHNQISELLKHLIADGHVDRVMKKFEGFISFDDIAAIAAPTSADDGVDRKEARAQLSTFQKKQKIYDGKKHLTIFCAAERGLCGKYNNSLMKHLYRHLVRNLRDRDVSIFTIGNKAKEAISKIEKEYKNGRKYTTLEHHLSKKLDFASIDEGIITPIFQLLSEGEYLSCDLVYSGFHSITTQEPTIINLWPLSTLLKELVGLKVMQPDDVVLSDDLSYDETSIESDDEEEMLKSARAMVEYDYDSVKRSIKENVLNHASKFQYDDSPESIVLPMVKKYLQSKIFNVLMESQKSEHAARMFAMDSAQRNSDELIKKLELIYNSTRQMQITSELVEIISGNEALGSNNGG